MNKLNDTNEKSTAENAKDIEEHIHAMVSRAECTRACKCQSFFQNSCETV